MEVEGLGIVLTVFHLLQLNLVMLVMLLHFLLDFYNKSKITLF